MLRRFRAHAVRRGYGGYQAFAFSRHITQQLLARPAKDISEFAAGYSRALSDKLASGGLQLARERAFVRFLSDRRLTAREKWDDIAIAGRTRKLIESAPPTMRADMHRYWIALEAERRYRRSGRETPRRLKSEHTLFLLLIRCARWMVDEGLTAWQQLTTERFREFIVAQGGAGRPKVMSNFLGRLKSFFEFLKAERRLFVNPLASMASPRAPLPRDFAVGANERRKWLVAVTSPAADHSTRAIGLLSILHGLAPHEMSELRLGDFKPKLRTLYLRRRRLTIPMDPVTHEALVAYVANRGDVHGNTYFLVSSKTKRTGRTVAYGYLAKRLRTAGIRWAQAPRQTLVRDVLESEDPVVAARLFGYSMDHVNKHLALIGGEKLLRLRRAPPPRS